MKLRLIRNEPVRNIDIHVLQSCYIYALQDSLSCRATRKAMLLADDCSRAILLYHAAVEQMYDFLGKCDRGDNPYDI